MKRRLSVQPLLVLLCCAPLFLTNCKSDSDSHRPAATASDTATVRLSLMPTVGTLPFYYAAAAGIYDSLGLAVHIDTRLSQFDCDTALLGTSAEAASSDVVRTQYYITRGENLVAAIRTEGSWSVVTSSKLRIKQMAQMKERTLAVARHSAADSVSRLAMMQGGLSGDAVFRPQINDIFLRASMLDNNQIDAAVLPEPQATLACLKGHSRIYKSPVDNALGCITFTKPALEKLKATGKFTLLVEGYNRAAARLNAKGTAVCRRTLETTYRFPAGKTDSLKLPEYQPIAALTSH